MAHAPGAYYVPHHSWWPVLGGLGPTIMLAGFAGYLQHQGWGVPVGLVGLAFTIVVMTGWFADVIRENRKGVYGAKEDMSFRWGMIWFIFSEVMFFGAFFGALFYARVFSIPWLAGDDPLTSRYLWEMATIEWPTAGFLDIEFTPMAAWLLPALNTAILLTSGLTVTIAHHAIKHVETERTKVIFYLILTIVLGLTFLGIQAYEYVHAWTDLNLRLDTGIYGSIFFMLTGFHGLHVFIGAVILIVMLARLLVGHFSNTDQFAFDAAAWYWHFVDVVWLFVFVFIYVL